MKGKVEDTIPMCQYGNRHIAIEFESEEELKQALIKLDTLFELYVEYLSRKQRGEI